MPVPARQIDENINPTEAVDTTYATLVQFDHDNRYIDDHYDELWELYPDQWIAMYRSMVMAVAPDIESLIKSLDRPVFADMDIRPEDVARRKLSKTKIL
jgi:hypothetical protein